ncbi:hypothetical protein Tco_0786474, partial [Tanacetum coccineum]
MMQASQLKMQIRNSLGVDWTSLSEDEQGNYALMACSSSGSDTE